MKRRDRKYGFLDAWNEGNVAREGILRKLGRGVANVAIGGICFVLLPLAAATEYLRGDRTFRSASRVARLAWLWTFTTTPGTEREKRLWKALSEAEARMK